MEKSVITLSDLILENSGGELDLLLRSFLCEKNPSIESFLHNKAILQEDQDGARTTLIFDDISNDIIGYYTIKLQTFNFTNASGKQRKSLAGSKEANSFLAILIAKLGRADKYKGIVKGSEILAYALSSCDEIKRLTAEKVVCVEFVDEPTLLKFYTDNQFIPLQRNENNLNIHFRKI
ncbi:hypothetical protein [Shouchella miscanthi]|uniref:GNAT family N-acetyltransferase n=1 Tax=Shouchella miscanthi TaxID=2598861 RepID=A0ABU6NHG0_9BACI|nr:hypothetical protein [Shouchella miscanthi]